MLELHKMKILSWVVVDDNISIPFFKTRVEGCIRGFVYQDKETKEICAEYRIKRPDGTRNWMKITADKEENKTAKYYTWGMEQAFTHVADLMHEASGEKYEVAIFYPPQELNDDETLEWLEKMDLIEVTGVKITEGEPS